MKLDVLDGIKANAA